MRKAFTLAELLVVIMVIAILSSTVVMTMYQAMDRARERRANAEIEEIGQTITGLWDAYRVKPVRMIPQSSGTIPVSFRRDAMQMARARLTAIRDVQRQELPDRISDVADEPLRTPTTPVSVELTSATGNCFVSAAKPTLSMAYYRYANEHAHCDHYTLAGCQNGCPSETERKTGIEFWKDTHEGAECLWLILRFNGDNHTFTSTENSIDVDNDGMPEVADPWGNPVEWIRWPCGWMNTYGVVSLHDTNKFDPFNPLRISPPDDPNTPPRDFALHPLVYSSGPDGKYDVNRGTVIYRDTQPEACDPYAPDPPVGLPMDADGDGCLSFMDNITNHAVEAR